MDRIHGIESLSLPEKASPLHKVLSFYFQKKQARSPKFSLRALSRRLGVSAPYVSSVLSGKKRLAPRHLPKLIEQLELDSTGVKQVQEAVGRQECIEIVRTRELEHWYDKALLKMVALKNFRPDTAWIARRLRINEKQAAESWQHLFAIGAVEQRDGLWRRSASYYGNTETTELQHLELAREELTKRLSAEDLKRRQTAGLTIAVNKDKLPQAQAMLAKSLQDIAALLGDEDATELYQLDTLLVPVTEDSDNC